MCKRCEEYINEDYAVPIGRTVKLNCGALGFIEGELSMCKSSDASDYYLELFLFPMETDNSKWMKTKINYCPFCGRKLRESK